MFPFFLTNISYITTPIGAPLIPQIPTLHYNKNLIVEIKEESDINGPIIKYEILMYQSNNLTIIYSNSTPGNVTLVSLNKDIVYEFQSKVFTSNSLFSLSEKTSYISSLEQNHDNEISWWVILLIVIGTLLLITFIMICVCHYNNNALNKVGDSVVVNNRPTSAFERTNPAYQGLNPIRRTQNPIYNGLNRRRSDSNYYSEVERPAITNAVYESLHTPSNPPDIAVPKNMLRS